MALTKATLPTETVTERPKPAARSTSDKYDELANELRKEPTSVFIVGESDRNPTKLNQHLLDRGMYTLAHWNGSKWQLYASANTFKGAKHTNSTK